MKPTNLGAALLALALPFVAGAGTTVDIEVLDRRTGRVLPVYWHDGDRHVAGEPGREYEIRLRNRDGCRVLAVTSVDGVNVITGRTASPAQSGYVLDPWGLVEIDGWRKSMDEVAAFYFTALPDSYAARTGRPDNVGVIGVALFRERARPDADGRRLPGPRGIRGARRRCLGGGQGFVADSPHATPRSPGSVPATGAASIPARHTRTSSARAPSPTRSSASTTTRAGTSSPAASSRRPDISPAACRSRFPPPSSPILNTPRGRSPSIKALIKVERSLSIVNATGVPS